METAYSPTDDGYLSPVVNSAECIALDDVKGFDVAVELEKIGFGRFCCCAGCNSDCASIYFAFWGNSDCRPPSKDSFIALWYWLDVGWCLGTSLARHLAPGVFSAFPLVLVSVA